MTMKKRRKVVTAGWATERGQRRRKNEDSAAAVNLDLLEGDVAQSVGIYAVADGMGGHRDGEIASRMAVNTAVRGLIDQITEASGKVADAYIRWLERAVQSTHRVVQNRNQVEESDMGTTLVMAVVAGNYAYIANVGDSRAYLITREGDIQQITQDHTMLKELVNRGVMSQEEATKHPYGSILSNAIGLGKQVEVDTFVAEFSGDGFLLLCSDGLTRELNDSRIREIVMNASSPQDACDQLVNAANEAGGRDNIAVVLIQFQDQSSNMN